MGAYGQFCPVAQASEIFAERWTPLLLRELASGSHRFADLHRGVPRMSRTLLARRLRSLERDGLVHHGSGDYHLTEAGRDLVPVLHLLGAWGQRWATANLDDRDLDPALLMWDIHRRVPAEKLPSQRVTVLFQFREVNKERYWLVLEAAGVDVCYKDPGHPVDLQVKTSLRALTKIWLGHARIEAALGDGTLDLDGPRPLKRAFAGWLGLSSFADQGRAFAGPRQTHSEAAVSASGPRG